MKDSSSIGKHQNYTYIILPACRRDKMPVSVPLLEILPPTLVAPPLACLTSHQLHDPHLSMLLISWLAKFPLF